MNPYIGDRQLEPDDEPECDHCDGEGIFIGPPCSNETLLDRIFFGAGAIKCPACNGTGVYCKPDMSDPGEPNEDPE